jgi:hypothetical protein
MFCEWMMNIFCIRSVGEKPKKKYKKLRIEVSESIVNGERETTQRVQQEDRFANFNNCIVACRSDAPLFV